MNKPITLEDVINEIKGIQANGWGRVEVVIGEARIVEVNVVKKIKEA